jgi:hypothetical protein
MAQTPKPTGNVIDYETGSRAIIYNKSSGYWVGLSIINDGASDLLFTVNSRVITVKPNETFEDNFADFSTITINSNVAYRLALKG